MKKVKIKIIENRLTFKPYLLEIEVEYQGGFVLRGTKEIYGSRDLTFELSQYSTRPAFYPTEIDFLVKILNDAKIISNLDLDGSADFKTLNDWRAHIQENVEQAIIEDGTAHQH